MPKAIVVSKTGGPEVLEIKQLKVPSKLKPGQVIVRHTAIGINYQDVLFRSGARKIPKIPFIPGIEACGVIEKIGPGVTGVEIGQRVAYCMAKAGAYCEKRVITIDKLVGVPDYISDEVAAAVLLKGMTAHYLVFRTYRLKKGDVVVVHSAAGGTGQFLCQWAKKLGSVVIGVVGSKQKVPAAKNAGCDHIIVSSEQNIAEEVIKITNGEGVPLVYDAVGQDTFEDTMACLRPLGLFVSYGETSGEIKDFTINKLSPKGIFITRPTLTLYKANRIEMALTANEVFEMVRQGFFNVNIHKTYSFSEIPQAHADLESRKTTGSLVIKL